MPQTKRKRGWKACDPFCQDKVRTALYNRPNGPHMGKLIMGKTYLSGIDGKCFSRTGRIKKGYRNVPIDLQREFEIEKRQIKEIRDMIRGPTQKQKNKKNAKKKKQKEEYEKEKAKKLAMQQNPETIQKNNNNNLMEHQNGIDDVKMDKNKIQLQVFEPMDKLSRMPNEPFGQFVRRVKSTTSYHLNKKKHKQNQQRLRRKERNLEKKSRKIEREADAKRLRKLEDKQRRQQQRDFERKIKPKKEYIPFGSTNDRPPVDLHKLGETLFKKRVNNPNDRNHHNVNIGALSFANVIKDRAQQMKKQEILKNYALIKKKRYEKLKSQIKNKKPKRKVW